MRSPMALLTGSILLKQYLHPNGCRSLKRRAVWHYERPAAVKHASELSLVPIHKQQPLEDFSIAAAENSNKRLDEVDAAVPATPVASTPEKDHAPPSAGIGKGSSRAQRTRSWYLLPDCGCELRLVGEDVSEILDMIAAQMKVIEVARLKKSCRCCEKMVQLPAPSRPIPGSMAGAGLLAYILVSKFDDHLPLYRLNEIFARMGADIPDRRADHPGPCRRTRRPSRHLHHIA
ncbi:transposase [Sinorhizobium meliloti]